VFIKVLLGLCSIYHKLKLQNTTRVPEIAKSSFCKNTTSKTSVTLWYTTKVSPLWKTRSSISAGGTMRVGVEGLSKSPQYNGRIGTIQGEAGGGRLQVVLDQDGKVLSLKRENLFEAQHGQDRRVAYSRAGKHTAIQQTTSSFFF
jgi:hypothetical protein